MDKITELRKKIDDVDKLIADCFVKRMNLVKEISEEKEKLGICVLNETRENEIKDRIADIMPDDMIKYGAELFEKLLEISRNYQTSKRG